MNINSVTQKFPETQFNSPKILRSPRQEPQIYHSYESDSDEELHKDCTQLHETKPVPIPQKKEWNNSHFGD